MSEGKAISLPRIRRRHRIARVGSISVLVVAACEGIALIRAGWWLSMVSGATTLLEYAFRLLHELLSTGWPVAVLVLAYWFRKQLVELADRVEEGAGMKFKPRQQELTATLPSPPTSAPVPPPAPTAAPETADVASATYTLKAETGSFVVTGGDIRFGLGSEDVDELAPDIAVVALAAQVEQLVKRIAAASGLLPKGPASFLQFLDALSPLLPIEVIQMAREFARLRNAVAHGRRVPMDAVADAVRAGKKLREYLSSRPERPPVVVNSDLQPYADAQGSTRQDGFRVMLLRWPQGNESAVPTKKPFTPGEQISWEWAIHGQVFREPTYFQHPDTGEIKEAWSSAMLFTGRPLSEI